MTDFIYYVEVPAHDDDTDPYRFFFTSEAERDEFAAALDDYTDDYGYPLAGVEKERVYRSSAEAIDSVKRLMGWSELPKG